MDRACARNQRHLVLYPFYRTNVEFRRCNTMVVRAQDDLEPFRHVQSASASHVSQNSDNIISDFLGTFFNKRLSKLVQLIFTRIRGFVRYLLVFVLLYLLNFDSGDYWLVH